MIRRLLGNHSSISAFLFVGLFVWIIPPSSGFSPLSLLLDSSGPYKSRIEVDHSIPRIKYNRRPVSFSFSGARMVTEDDPQDAVADDNNKHDEYIMTKNAVQGVTLKIAFDKHWGVADLSEDKSERFTCGGSLDMVHRLRKESDAVLVGRRTVEIDDCSLTIRRIPSDTQPLRVVVDPNRLLVLGDFRIATDGMETVMYHLQSDETTTASTTTTTAVVDEFYPNVQHVELPASSKGSNSVKSVLSAKAIWEDLQANHNVQHVMVEGGPATAMQFLREGLVDRAILVFAPIEFKDPAPSHLSHSDFQAAGLVKVDDSLVDETDRVEYWSRPDLPWPKEPASEWP